MQVCVPAPRRGTSPPPTLGGAAPALGRLGEALRRWLVGLGERQLPLGSAAILHGWPRRCRSRRRSLPFALAGPARLLCVCGGGDVGGTRHREIELRQARAGGGSAMRACLTPYLGGGSGGGLPAAPAADSRPPPGCVCGGGRGGYASEGKRAPQGTYQGGRARAEREGRACAAGPIPGRGQRGRSCPRPWRSFPPPAGVCAGGGTWGGCVRGTAISAGHARGEGGALVCCWTHTEGGGATAVLPLALPLPPSSCRCVCVWGGGAWRGRGVRV